MNLTYFPIYFYLNQPKNLLFNVRKIYKLATASLASKVSIPRGRKKGIKKPKSIKILK